VPRRSCVRQRRRLGQALVELHRIAPVGTHLRARHRASGVCCQLPCCREAGFQAGQRSRRERCFACSRPWREKPAAAGRLRS
jgi:hypothetical protein